MLLSSGCNFLKKSFFDQSLEDFYKEARDKFEFRFDLKSTSKTVLCEDFNILQTKDLGAFGFGLKIQHKKNKAGYVNVNVFKFYFNQYFCSDSVCNESVQQRNFVERETC